MIKENSYNKPYVLAFRATSWLTICDILSIYKEKKERKTFSINLKNDFHGILEPKKEHKIRAACLSVYKI